jgi:uncharacterized protein YjbJ (UPF0337 family)
MLDNTRRIMSLDAKDQSTQQFGDQKLDDEELKARWIKLTDEDVAAIAGSRDELINTLQHRYGFERDQAEKDVNDYFNGAEPQ